MPRAAQDPRPDSAGAPPRRIQQVFEILRRVERAGVVTRYAIGGAVGATFYLEPVATLDIDVFVGFPTTGLPIDPSPVFTWLVATQDPATAHGPR